MPINLLKLPRSVGVLVVTELEYQEIFLLSICSHRTSCLVKKARVKVPNLAFRYGRSCGYKTFEVGVRINIIDRKIWLPVTAVLHVPRLEAKKMLTVKLGNDQEADTNFDMWRLKNEQFIHRFKCAIEPTAVQKALRDYINSLFHYSSAYKLVLSMKREESLPNITNVAEIYIDHITVDPAFLANVMTTYPDTQSVSVFSSIVGDIPNESPFFQIPHFYVPNGPSSCGPDYIHNFFGRNLCLERAICTDQDLIQFLRKWISNEAYYNLETMILSTVSKINRDMILQTIEYVEYGRNEPTMIPHSLYFDIPYFRSTPTEYILRIEKVVEIKRITDGQRAFLIIKDYCFDFLIHNK